MKRVIEAIEAWFAGRKNTTSPGTNVYLPEIESLHGRIRSLAKIIDVPGEFTATGNGADFGWGRVEYEENYSYSYVERGDSYDVRVTDDMDEVLCWVFSDITWALASNYELIHRAPKSRDIRRLLFSHQLKLLGRINPEWADRRRSEIDRILTDSPFEDDLAAKDK